MFDNGNKDHRGALHRFEAELRATPDSRGELAAGLIGKTACVDGPFGSRPLVYADYVASGRAVRQVEKFVQETVLPYYANSHTEASYCGALMTRMREESRAMVLEKCHASIDDHALVLPAPARLRLSTNWCIFSAWLRQSQMATGCVF